MFCTPDDEIPRQTIFDRKADNAEIEILPDADFDRSSPHRINYDFVIEGIVLPSKVRRPVWFKNGKKNYDGIGKEESEETTERAPFVLVAHRENEDTPWLDVAPYLTPAQSMTLGKTKLDFSKYSKCPNMMTYEMSGKIIECHHINGFESKKLLEDLRTEFRRLVEVDDQVSTVLSIWIFGTYVFDAFPSYPYVWLNGMKGTGKTRILEFIAHTGYHAVLGASISNPALFRLVDEHHSVVCYDEAENLLRSGGHESKDKDRISLFNSGYRSSGKVMLCEKEGDNWVNRTFNAYSPKALASIQPIDDALQSRCLIVPMMKALKGEYSEADIDDEYCAKLREQLYFFRFAEGIRLRGNSKDDQTKKRLRKEHGLKNRDWELFAPLLVIADAINPDYIPDIAEFIGGQKVMQDTDNRFTTEAMVALELLELADKGRNMPDDAMDRISYKDFITELKAEYPELKWMVSRSLGNVLRRIGMSGLLKRVGKGHCIILDYDRISKNVERLGLDGDDYLKAKKGGLHDFE